MHLLSRELVTSDYSNYLRKDLLRATVCRFLVAYVSQNGLDILGADLARVLHDPRSFGVASISCSCGYMPLLNLQNSLPSFRLKYFMDPQDHTDGESDDIALLHSKLVYLFLEAEQKSVVYIGSHNWTARALGPSNPRNAEASMRLEFNFTPDHLDGSGPGLPSCVNAHLLEAWKLPVCIPTIEANRHKFEEWYETGCQRQPPSPLEDSIVVLGVRKSQSPTPVPSDWQDLEGKGLYMQALVEHEGHLVWRSGSGIFVMVWDSDVALQQGLQPIILRCRVATNNAGPDSAERGTNQSNAPISGFRAVLWDQQVTALANYSSAVHPPVPIWSGRQAEFFDFQFPLDRADSSEAYDAGRPKYQFHFEVEQVAFPADGGKPRNPRMVWEPESFGVAAKKDEARLVKSRGFYVEPQEEVEMLRCYTEVFRVQLSRARVLPYSNPDEYRIGKRIARHPLHDTFMGTRHTMYPEEFYSKSQRGATVPDLEAMSLTVPPGEIIRRVQRVFTSPWKSLVLQWSAVSQHYSE